MCAGLAHAAPALAASTAASTAAFLPAAFLVMLQTVTHKLLQQASQTSSPEDKSPSGKLDLTRLNASDAALLQGCCSAQAAVCAVLGEQQSSLQQQHGNLQNSQQKHQQQLFAAAVRHLRAVLAASKNGKLTGAAASSLGSVLNSALSTQGLRTHLPSDSHTPQHRAQGAADTFQNSSQPIKPDSESSQQRSHSSAQHGVVAEQVLTESELKRAVSDIIAGCDYASKLPSAAMAKQGLAMGLAAFLKRAEGRETASALLERAEWKQQAHDALKVCCRHSEVLHVHDTSKPVVTSICRYPLMQYFCVSFTLIMHAHLPLNQPCPKLISHNCLLQHSSML